jgi:hypothetical protein
MEAMVKHEVIEREDAWVASGNVVVTELGDGLALLNLATNEYFSLNDVGAFVWGVLQTPQQRGEIIRAVTEKYEVAPDICAPDVDLLLEDLKNAALAEQQLGAAA